MGLGSNLWAYVGCRDLCCRKVRNSLRAPWREQKLTNYACLQTSAAELCSTFDVISRWSNLPHKLNVTTLLHLYFHFLSSFYGSTCVGRKKSSLEAGVEIQKMTKWRQLEEEGGGGFYFTRPKLNHCPLKTSSWEMKGPPGDTATPHYKNNSETAKVQ